MTTPTLTELQQKMVDAYSELGQRLSDYAVRSLRVQVELTQAQVEIDRLRGVLQEVRDDFDHDEDAHRYGTRCRCCIANDALGGPKP
jgi:hypothetical protein